MSGNIFETIREQVGVIELAERSTKLKRVGSVMKGHCPLPGHDDSTPSFCVYDDHVHCFGCRFHGDVISLWGALKGFQSQFEAALDLARDYNITPPAKDPEAEKNATERRRREDDYERQAIICHQDLSNCPEVIKWWESRGFDEELRQRFLLGTTPNGSAATIPFWYKSRVQGLIRRQLKQQPKYLLPKAEDFPEGHRPLFIPGRLSGDVHLVEGYVDALSLAALGFSAVAIGGTGISENQKAELHRLKGRIYILPDTDDEGKKASRAWARELFPQAKLCLAEYDGKGAT
jgi:DNA primase